MALIGLNGGLIGSQRSAAIGAASGLWTANEQVVLKRAGLWSVVTDSNAATYIAAVEAADGQPLENAVKTAINTFVVGCKADGIWTALKASCILAGARTLSGALVPLVGTAPTNFNFVSGDYNRETGLVGNGSTKYLDSNRNNNADPQNSKHLAVQGSVTVTAGTYQGFCGPAYNDIGWSALILDNRSPSGFQAWINGSTYPSGMAPLAAQSGFFGASRSNGSNVTARINSTNYTSTVTSQTPSNGNIRIFDVLVFSDARIAFYSIGESLNLALLDARVTTLLNAIAAAIP
jgi:hypothetical protein